jgi:prepilin-type N-terminal cleavage/methylation domain-containing protein
MLRRKLLARGFSLAEVMVVIVIMMVLASISLVGLSSAHRKALTVQCINNLWQLGTVIHTYTTQTGGGLLPDFSIGGDRVREQWVWELDFVSEDERYLARQNSEAIDQILPPRLSPPLLTCPADVQLFVNSQSILTSYWMHPENAYKPIGSIAKPDKTILAFEGDPLYETANCGCRFHTMIPPYELDTTHQGGAHILFINGSVRYYHDPVERRRETWEERAGWDIQALKAKFLW